MILRIIINAIDKAQKAVSHFQSTNHKTKPNCIKMKVSADELFLKSKIP